MKTMDNLTKWNTIYKKKVNNNLNKDTGLTSYVNSVCVLVRFDNIVLVESEDVFMYSSRLPIVKKWVTMWRITAISPLVPPTSKKKHPHYYTSIPPTRIYTRPKYTSNKPLYLCPLFLQTKKKSRDYKLCSFKTHPKKSIYDLI